MKDLDKNIDNLNDGSLDIHNDNDFSVETVKNNDDFKNNKNLQEGEKEYKPRNEDQGQDYASKAQADDSKKEAFGEKAQNDTQKEESFATVNRQYSSSYTPPYYVPNFTINSTPTQPAPEPKRNKTGFKLMIIAGVLLVFMLLAFIAGAFAKSVFQGFEGYKDSINLGGEQLNIIQNSPTLNITKNADIDYVPQSLPEVVAKVGNSVVEIKTSSTESGGFYGQYVSSGAGSGIIVTQSDEAGYIITNHHVIHKEDYSLADSITVVLTNGEEYSAVEMGSDYSIDLAVLRIEKKDSEVFTVAQWGDSSKLLVGQEVIAIGNPLGSLGGTVTDGIVSALDRQVKVDGVNMTLLQHNAAINPGNSGGGLFDMMGNLIGVVNAKQSESGIEGLGFAIPADIAFNFFNRVMVKEPAIGIKVQYGQINRVYGVYVVEATNTDFVLYDRVLKINDTAISTPAEYYAAIDCFELGDTFSVTVERVKNKVKTQVTINLTMEK